MSNHDLDPTTYTQLPLFDVAGATALATALMTAMPKSMPAQVHSVAAEMMAAARDLADSWRVEGAPRPDIRRPADIALDRSWSGLHRRLDAYADLPVESFPEANVARGILDKVFPGGLAFLKLPYLQEWAESQKRLELIELERLDGSIGALAGDAFLTQVRRCHEVYGRVLGITALSPDTQIPVRAEKLRELRRTMTTYVFNVLGQLTNDPDSAEVIQKALRPIDDLRASNANRRDVDTEAVEVIEETKVVAPAPTASPTPTASATPANGPNVAASRAVSVPASNGTPS